MSDVLLRGVVGSVAYGLAREGSDVDTMAVFIAPRRRVLGFGLHAWEQTRRQQSPDPHDTVEHEIQKYLGLALRCNPSVLELLWLPEYEVMTPWGEALVDTRKAFLAAPNVFSAYVGYVQDQAARLAHARRFPDVPVSRIEKHGRHCARLLLQALNLLDSGELLVRLEPREVDTCRMMGILAASGDGSTFQKNVDRMSSDLESIVHRSPLPQEPDREQVASFLVTLRAAQARHVVGW